MAGPSETDVVAAVRAAWCRETRDGVDVGVHWWNRLPDGTEADPTREQFAPDEVVQSPRVVPRPPGPPRRCAGQYLRLRDAVVALGLDRDGRRPAR